MVFSDSIVDLVEGHPEPEFGLQHVQSSKSNSDQQTHRFQDRSSISSAIFGRLRSSLDKVEYRGEEQKSVRLKEQGMDQHIRLRGQDSLNTCLFSYADTYKESLNRDR